MINGLSSLRDVSGVGMAEIDVAGIDLEVADIGAAKKTANGAAREAEAQSSHENHTWSDPMAPCRGRRSLGRPSAS